MRTAIVAILGAWMALTLPTAVEAGCGCDKPPPPRASVRPFVASKDQRITLFDVRLVSGLTYDIKFTPSAGGTPEWVRRKAVSRRDFADGQYRVQLRTPLPRMPLGPCAISVWKSGQLVYSLADDQFTVAARPIALQHRDDMIVRENYQAAVGRDGTIFIPFDLGQVDDATTFTGKAYGLPLHFDTSHIAMYNTQGFLMQLLDPSAPGWITPSADATSSTELIYWRHEFRTYKDEHRWDEDREASDGEWHADGTYHVDHDLIVVAIAGTLPGNTFLTPGATAPFTLVVNSYRGETTTAEIDREDD
jgi:hypothetical protein